VASAEVWVKRVEEWRASGQSAVAFAAGRGYEGSTLRWWASRLARQQPALVRVVPASEVARDAGIELHVGGVRVVVRRGFDRALLADVLDVIREKAPS